MRASSSSAVPCVPLFHSSVHACPPMLTSPAPPNAERPPPNAHAHAHPRAQDPADNTLAPFTLAGWTPDPAVAAVLCGLDTSVTYAKLSKAFTYLQRPGVAFLATNTDSTYPSAEGLLPGAGSISAPLRCALGREPLAIGKPQRTMLDCIKAK